MGESLLMHNVTATLGSSTKITFGSSAFLWHVPRRLKPEEGATRQVFPIKLRLGVCGSNLIFSVWGRVCLLFYLQAPTKVPKAFTLAYHRSVFLRHFVEITHLFGATRVLHKLPNS